MLQALRVASGITIVPRAFDIRKHHRIAAAPETALRLYRGRQLAVRSMATTATSGKLVVSTDKAPGAVGPYSQAIKAGNTVYLSGQVALVPGTKDLAATDVEGQTEQVMKNLSAVLEAAGSSFSQVVKTTVLLTDMADFAKVNAIYARYFPEQPPARACYAVKALPLGALVEIEAVALSS